MKYVIQYIPNYESHCPPCHMVDPMTFEPYVLDSYNEAIRLVSMTNESEFWKILAFDEKNNISD